MSHYIKRITFKKTREITGNERLIQTAALVLMQYSSAANVLAVRERMHQRVGEHRHITIAEIHPLARQRVDGVRCITVRQKSINRANK